MENTTSPTMVLFENSVLSTSNQASGMEISAEKKELWRIVKASFKHYKKGDIDALIGVDIDESLERLGSETSSLDDDTIPLRCQKREPYEKPVSYDLEPISIITLGDVANISYRYKLRGNKMGGSGRIMETWIKQHNKWKLMGSMTVHCDKLPVCDVFVSAHLEE